MKKFKFFSIILFFSYALILRAFAETQANFMTPRDLENNDSASNLSLQNNRNAAATVYGIYVRQYAYVTPGQSCNTATVIYSTTNNTTAGAFVMPTLINAGKKAVVGSNYLYNMIYETIYYENIIIPSSPPGCALPGCTWGSDTTRYNWCIFLGALAPVSTTTGYTANVPPSTDFASSTGIYNYDLVNNYNYLGPISCNDRTLTCTSASQQTQSFS